MTKPWAFYNDNDPFICEWIKNLMAEGLIAPGMIDNRPIQQVQGDDLREFQQVHMFCGIGGWSLALRLAGVPDDEPIWTGSCPCQPFSAAGKRKGIADARHLWPEFYRLIGERRPARVFGEQVASKDGRLWLTGVRVDLEALGYGVGAADLCAAGCGAPHIRQRLYWMADAQRDTGGPGRLAIEPGEGTGAPEARPCGESRRRGLLRSSVADAYGRLAGDGELQPCGQHGQQQEDGGVGGGLDDSTDTRQSRSRVGGSTVATRDDARLQELAGRSTSGGMGDANNKRLQERPGEADGRRTLRDKGAPIASSSLWDRNVLILCADGKQRRVPADKAGQLEPALFPLADAGTIRNRVGTLRGSGNAIAPQLASEFIRAALECTP